MPTPATEKRRAERQAEAERAAKAVADHETYVVLCKARGLNPLPMGLEWAIVMETRAFGSDVIPYVSSIGTLWVRNLKHKTGRMDRPLAVAQWQALKGMQT
jgi:hypothetical protein